MMDGHELKLLQNAILPDMVKLMVQNFQKRSMKVHTHQSKEYLKILDDYTKEFDKISCLNLAYLETTKLITELDTQYSKKVKLK